LGENKKRTGRGGRGTVERLGGEIATPSKIDASAQRQRVDRIAKIKFVKFERRAGEGSIKQQSHPKWKKTGWGKNSLGGALSLHEKKKKNAASTTLSYHPPITLVGLKGLPKKREQ